jgi:flagellar L-ring protein FlgH
MPNRSLSDTDPHRRRPPAAALLLISMSSLLAVAAPSAHAQLVQKAKNKINPPAQPDPLLLYIKRAHQWAATFVPTAGSLWSPEGLMADMASDSKARYLGDQITIALSESTTSALQGSVQTQRTLSASTNFGNLLGGFGQKPAVQALLNPSSTQTLNGKGQTALSTSLSTTLAANVVDVLPNGLLVVEGRRAVNVTDQRQTLAIRGIVRRDDISPNNVVNSTAISQMEVEVVGKGVITEGTHPPNPVMRFLFRIFGF